MNIQIKVKMPLGKVLKEIINIISLLMMFYIHTEH